MSHGKKSKMALYPKPLEELIDSLKKLPTIGQRGAERLTFHLLKSSEEENKMLGEAILNLKRRIKSCSICNNITENEPCTICRDEKRDRKLICVVEEFCDVTTLEKTNYNGVYHVLGGKISPLEGIGPDTLKIKELVERLKRDEPREVIIATNTDTEGETTALYLSKLLKSLNVPHSRIAHGLPLGSSIGNTDQFTLTQAMEGRRKIG